MNSTTDTTFFKLLSDKFPHDPTAKQSVALQQLATFVLSKERDIVFLLKGYAGTGKTTIVGTIVTNLWKTTMKAVLMAPTGRAAKVMSNYSGTQARSEEHTSELQ